MRAGDEPVEVCEGAEDRVDIAIVGDVISEIVHRRGIEWREPDRIDPKRGDIVEPRRDPREIPDGVAVRIGIAARIDLIDDRALPPQRLRFLGGGWEGREFVHRVSQIMYPSGGRVMASCPGAAAAAGHSPRSAE